jgi:hypothetical protein
LSKKVEIPPSHVLMNLYWREFKSGAEIAEIFGISDNLVYKWLRTYKISRRPSATTRKGSIVQIDGIPHKKCFGVLHPKGGVYLPLRSFWKFRKGPRAGLPFSQCIECERSNKNRGEASGLVPISKVWWIFLELERRLGRAETCRRIGVSHNFWMRVERRIYLNMRIATARRAIITLREVRLSGEVRHRDSIRHGAYLRGRKEKIPTKQEDFYHPSGDNEAEYKRKYVKQNPDYIQRQSKARAKRIRKKRQLKESSLTSDLQSGKMDTCDYGKEVSPWTP